MEQKPEVLRVISKRAQEYNTVLKVYGEDFRADNIRYYKNGSDF